MNLDNVLYMEQGKNYSFGSEPKKIIDLSQNEIKVSNLRDADFNNFIHHDKNAGNPAIESLLAAMSEIPDLPTPLGVFREVDLPSYDDLMHEQINLVKAEKGEGSLDVLLNSGETWEVK